MPLHNVPESDSFDVNVQMPLDGDPADSSDFESSSIRPLTNRTRWLKNKLDVFREGGALALLADLVYTIADGKTFKFQADTFGGGTGLLDLQGIFTVFAGNTRGPLVQNGNSGRVPKKVLYIVSLSVDTEVDTDLYDTVIVGAVTADAKKIYPAATTTNGNYLRVVNKSNAHTIEFRKPGPGALLRTLQIAPDSSTPQVAEAAYVTALTDWVMCGGWNPSS